MRLEEEKPIFNKQRIDFAPPEKINHLAVCNNQLCMSLGKDTLLRQITSSDKFKPFVSTEFMAVLNCD